MRFSYFRRRVSEAGPSAAYVINTFSGGVEGLKLIHLFVGTRTVVFVFFATEIQFA